MFLLNGDAFREFNLELVIVDGFSVNLHRQLFWRRCLKETRNVVGDAHQVDGRRTLVDQGHGGLNLLRSVRAEASSGVGLLHLCFEHFEFLFLERHASFSGLDRLGKDRVDQLVGEVGLGLGHDGALF